MTLQNILNRTLLLSCILGALQFGEPVAKAMDEVDDKKNGRNSPTTASRKDNVILHGNSGSPNQEDSVSTKEELDLSQEICLDNKDPKTPPQKTNPFLRSFTDPTPNRPPFQDNILNLNILKPSIQWVGHRDFMLVDENTRHSYGPLDDHFNLRKIVDDNVKYFPGTENLFSLQLTFLVSSRYFGIESFRTLSYSLRAKHQEKIKNLLFVSGSASIKNDDMYYVFSGSDVNLETKNQWFKEIYGKTCEDLRKSNAEQTYYHSEQWAMIRTFQQIENAVNQLYKNNQISKIHGVFLEGHTWNDPCEICQEMFHKKVPELEKKIKTLLKEKDILAEPFFVLPVLSSQDWYKSKRLKPLDIQNLECLSCKKSNTKGTKDDKEKKTKKLETCNRFFQYTTDYKMRLENQDLQNSFDIRTGFVNKRSFPCFWLYKEREVQETLKSKVSRTFTTAWTGYYEIKRKLSGPYLFFDHPTLKIQKNLPLYPFPKTTLELAQFKNLTSLMITSQMLKEDGAKELAIALPQLTALTSLNLENNEFGIVNTLPKKNLFSFLHSINNNSQKDISNAPSKPVYFQSLIGSLAPLKNLKILNLSKNIFEKDAVEVLSKTLTYLENLENLSLQETRINYPSADYIVQQARLMTCIVSIDLSKNFIFKDCKEEKEIEERAISLFQNVIRGGFKKGKFFNPIKLNLDNNTPENIN